MSKLAQNVTDKYLEVFMPLPQKYTIEITGNNFELLCNGNFRLCQYLPRANFCNLW